MHDLIMIFTVLSGLKKMSSSTGWCNLAEAQFKMQRYSDSAVSCSQGMFTLLYITVVIQMTSQTTCFHVSIKSKEYVQSNFIRGSLKNQLRDLWRIWSSSKCSCRLPLKLILNFIVCVLLCSVGLTVCASEDKELKVKLLKLKLEALVRSGGEKAADQALETFALVMWLTTNFFFYSVNFFFFFLWIYFAVLTLDIHV